MAILHHTVTLPALMPRYVERFRCIGASCEDSCCSGWPVHIDKKTYNAYRSKTFPILRQLETKLRRVEGAESDAMYATIEPVGEHQNCAAFKNGSCTVQASIGESFLSNVCHTFPRVNRSINGHFEQAMSLSCPEAARLALLAEDAFDFVESPAGVRVDTVHAIEMSNSLMAEAMTEARIFCLNLMRTRELLLWQRLALLGTFCEALTSNQRDQDGQNVQALIKDFTQLIESSNMTATLDLIRPDHGAQAKVFALLWSAKGFTATSPFQQSVIEQLSRQLGADEHGVVSESSLIRGYQRGLARLDEALQQTPYLLEHFVLNEMFTQLVPFNSKDAYDSYLGLIARFGLLRLLLAAQCNTTGGLPPVATLMATVHLHCRRFQHDRAYTVHVKNALRDSGWAGLDRLYTLLRT
ncbi:flagellin lysine-N-methylase [Massilia sp. YIM B02443]|uniref:flagellin lysine-N-methylase n=1 Tax=Massilia sp. YIM B02443 TaxID=3050127 RepID=UPI0025B72BAE|nr:flagellin lysine-N-methylase [Massilia sp. YIM B02443]MDN4035781.1 flagellin lysine-N-methylase [Massilia sp. YIM B02443]